MICREMCRRQSRYALDLYNKCIRYARDNALDLMGIGNAWNMWDSLHNSEILRLLKTSGFIKTWTLKQRVFANQEWKRYFPVKPWQLRKHRLGSSSQTGGFLINLKFLLSKTLNPHEFILFIFSVCVPKGVIFVAGSPAVIHPTVWTLRLSGFINFDQDFIIL